MYQEEVEALKEQFYAQKISKEEAQMEDFFEKRLEKIRNYN